MDGDESFLELSQIDNPDDIELFQSLKSDIIRKENQIPDQFQWLSLEIQSLSRYTQKTLKNMMVQLQRLGKVEQNEDLQPIARELNHHIQQSGMEYMRKMSWISEKLRRQTILFACKDQDSVLLEQSLLQDKENLVDDNQPRAKTIQPRILQENTKMQQGNRRIDSHSTTTTPSKPLATKVEPEKLSIPHDSSSVPSSNKSREEEVVHWNPPQSVHNNMASSTPSNVESNVNASTEESSQVVETEKKENPSVSQEPVFQSVKDRIQQFSSAIHEQDREKQLEQYTKASLLSKRSNSVNTAKTFTSSPEKPVSRPSLSRTEERKEETSQKSLEALLPTTENTEETKWNLHSEKNRADDELNQAESKKQSQSNFRQRSSSTQVKPDRRKFSHDENSKNTYASSHRKSFSSAKPQLWANLPPIPVENLEKMKEAKKTGRDAPDKFSLTSKSKNIKSKEFSSKVMKKEEVTSLFSAFKHGWSKLAKSHDLQLFKKTSPRKGSLDHETMSSSNLRSTKPPLNVPDALETSFPQSDLSRIHEPAAPLYPIQDKVPSLLQPSAPVLSNNNSILSEQAISSPDQDHAHWIDCQTTDGRRFRWNMHTQQVQWCE